MATRKVASTKAKSKAPPDPVSIGSIWLAGVGALSLGRKHGEAVLGNLIGEGRRLQRKARKLVGEAAEDLRAQAAGVVLPVRERFQEQIQSAGSAFQSGMAVVLSRFGIPTKADIDELSRHINALARQLKAAK